MPNSYTFHAAGEANCLFFHTTVGRKRNVNAPYCHVIVLRRGKNEAKKWLMHMKLLAAVALHQAEPDNLLFSPGHACKVFGRMPHRVPAAQGRVHRLLDGAPDRNRARRVAGGLNSRPVPVSMTL
uniref:Uncharacterized protein n=1 Tax=Oryza meridionalis TaxID=40149 RepID=A0A0E0C709_9ORYZ